MGSAIGPEDFRDTVLAYQNKNHNRTIVSILPLCSTLSPELLAWSLAKLIKRETSGLLSTVGVCCPPKLAGSPSEDTEHLAEPQAPGLSFLIVFLRFMFKLHFKNQTPRIFSYFLPFN